MTHPAMPFIALCFTIIFYIITLLSSVTIKFLVAVKSYNGPHYEANKQFGSITTPQAAVFFKYNTN